MEMGRRDVKRGVTNRFTKKQSGSGFATKSKKRLLKKLGLADEKLNRKMSYEFSASDLENEVSRKKPKLPKKNMKDSNGVDHASVPRKLRSAMKKRNPESVSKLTSASKRIGSCKKDLIKMENQEMEAKAIVPESMMISNDEKEVAETLYGLAGMFTESSSIDKKTCGPSEPLSGEKETSKLDSILVVEADFKKTEPLDPEVSALSSAKTDEKPQLEQFDKQRSSTGMVGFIDRLKQSSSVNVADSPTRAIESKVATSETEYKSNGLSLWPGLSSTIQSSSHVFSKPSSSTKLPPWMGQAVSPSKNASLLSEPLRVQPRKLKKCASHIYISRLIKTLQNSKSSPATLINQIEQRSSETSQRGLSDPVTTVNDFESMVSPSKRYQTPHLLDLHKSYIAKPVQEDMTQLALELYGPHTSSQKQSYNFLSLSSASAGAAQSHLPLPNSFPQYPISAAYNSHLQPSTSSHQMQQMSPYLASRFQTAYNANQQQQQQLQKRIWAAQYRPSTSGNIAPPSSNQYSKPNLSLNLTSSIQQPLHVASSPMYSTSFPMYSNNVSQQQHRLMAAAAAMSMSHHHDNSLSRKVLNRQENHFPLVYEDTRTSLQLLCNEQS
ncbi:unnamed protein product [Thlaspi arvense]|uniref:Uncharacterized protein n=1 Tax=Thlaspi arvense TaxID=13288 RepID=A0AAU9SJB7_THLAR|nr:unnamed protein product [Thlaspi arvense]